MTASDLIGARTRALAIPHGWLIALLSATVLVLFVVSLSLGYAPLNLTRAAADLMQGQKTLAALVLVELRIPRALLGCFVGFSLGLTGAAMQGLMRNPLAEPGIIGVSGAAALGAVTTFYFGLAGAFALALPLGGVAGAVSRRSFSTDWQAAARAP